MVCKDELVPFEGITCSNYLITPMTRGSLLSSDSQRPVDSAGRAAGKACQDPAHAGVQIQAAVPSFSTCTDSFVTAEDQALSLMSWMSPFHPDSTKAMKSVKDKVE